MNIDHDKERKIHIHHVTTTGKKTPSFPQWCDLMDAIRSCHNSNKSTYWFLYYTVQIVLTFEFGVKLPHI